MTTTDTLRATLPLTRFGTTDMYDHPRRLRRLGDRRAGLGGRLGRAGRS